MVECTIELDEVRLRYHKAFAAHAQACQEFNRYSWPPPMSYRTGDITRIQTQAPNALEQRLLSAVRATRAELMTAMEARADLEKKLRNIH